MELPPMQLREWFATAVFWFPYVLGIAISIYAFAKLQQKGYLLIAMSFFSPVVAKIAQEISYQIHQEEIEAVAAERNRELRERQERGEIVIIEEEPLKIPFFELILVFGLFLVSRTTIRERTRRGM